MSSPQLDEPSRSPERAALDLAVQALVILRRVLGEDDQWPRTTAKITATLHKIESIVPGSTGRGMGNP